MIKAITPIAELIFYKERSILHMRLIENSDMDLENTRKHYAIIDEITMGKKYGALIDSAPFFTMNPQSSQFASSLDATEKRIAAAHYNISAANKMTLNFFKSRYKPAMPLEAFETKEEAEKWLMEILDQTKKEMH